MLRYITCVMFCYITCVMLCYITCVMLCYIRQRSHCGLFFYVASYVAPQICHDIYATGVVEVARVGHK